MNTIINLFISDLSGVILLAGNAIYATVSFRNKWYRWGVLNCLTALWVGYWLVQ